MKINRVIFANQTKVGAWEFLVKKKKKNVRQIYGFGIEIGLPRPTQCQTAERVAARSVMAHRSTLHTYGDDVGVQRESCFQRALEQESCEY
jgi:hypothetical protein